MNDLEDSKPPHIIFIMADDLGWNDVGYHGSDEIPTPNIDALAYNGIILNRYYVLPVCTPSRSALMTGRHPIHNGMQHRVLFGVETRGLPLTEKLLPEYLQKLGYSTHIVGKWHLGFYKKEYTPLYRGFESHIGFWTGHQDYYDHTAEEERLWGLDMRHGMKPAWYLHGEYSTHVYTRESVKIIKNYNSTKPLFLYVAHAAVHSGNKYNPLPAPDKTVDKLDHIQNYNRRRYAAMVSELDTSVGNIISALKDANMLSNSIVIFSTDNGGPANGLNYNYASNWPMRGVKNTLWEGGVRGVGVVWSSKFKPNSGGRVSNRMMHICDWLPTLYAAAGGDVRDLGENLDGYNMWNSLLDDLPSPRNEILHNIDDIFGNSALTMSQWKLVKGTTYNGFYDSWFGPTGRNPGYFYNIGQVLSSLSNKALSTLQTVPLNPESIRRIREEATIDCGNHQLISSESRFSNCNPLKESCLFNVDEDPCEIDNVAKSFPQVVKEMEERLLYWNSTAVKPAKVINDLRGNPKFWGYVWTNFGDYNS
ncbi:arylsulfatase J precursor, putative [Pediculus humanus corporis]|uniref:Arylsulfatase J, putative n=1 Tax=Pediculus humanus subsp. corporis TaxID=121224 RepID=E0W3F1_PEDHC|nr:arylsulfatase J precursor, putative [Pediculus humanus corporis]EEB20157.1 arylsulfatase J precursor, putative [Pediculus humanus corporis]